MSNTDHYPESPNKSADRTEPLPPPVLPPNTRNHEQGPEEADQILPATPSKPFNSIPQPRQSVVVPDVSSGPTFAHAPHLRQLEQGREEVDRILPPTHNDPANSLSQPRQSVAVMGASLRPPPPSLPFPFEMSSIDHYLDSLSEPTGLVEPPPHVGQLEQGQEETYQILPPEHSIPANSLSQPRQSVAFAEVSSGQFFEPRPPPPPPPPPPRIRRPRSITLAFLPIASLFAAFVHPSLSAAPYLLIFILGAPAKRPSFPYTIALALVAYSLSCIAVHIVSAALISRTAPPPTFADSILSAGLPRYDISVWYGLRALLGPVFALLLALFALLQKHPAFSERYLLRAISLIRARMAVRQACKKAEENEAKKRARHPHPDTLSSAVATPAGDTARPGGEEILNGSSAEGSGDGGQEEERNWWKWPWLRSSKVTAPKTEGGKQKLSTGAPGWMLLERLEEIVGDVGLDEADDEHALRALTVYEFGVAGLSLHAAETALLTAGIELSLSEVDLVAIRRRSFVVASASVADERDLELQRSSGCFASFDMEQPSKLTRFLSGHGGMFWTLAATGLAGSSYCSLLTLMFLLPFLVGVVHWARAPARFYPSLLPKYALTALSLLRAYSVAYLAVVYVFQFAWFDDLRDHSWVKLVGLVPLSSRVPQGWSYIMATGAAVACYVFTTLHYRAVQSVLMFEGISCAPSRVVDDDTLTAVSEEMVSVPLNFGGLELGGVGFRGQETHTEGSNAFRASQGDEEGDASPRGDATGFCDVEPTMSSGGGRSAFSEAISRGSLHDIDTLTANGLSFHDQFIGSKKPASLSVNKELLLKALVHASTLGLLIWALVFPGLFSLPLLAASFANMASKKWRTRKNLDILIWYAVGLEMVQFVFSAITRAVKVSDTRIVRLLGLRTFQPEFSMNLVQSVAIVMLCINICAKRFLRLHGSKDKPVDDVHVSIDKTSLLYSTEVSLKAASTAPLRLIVDQVALASLYLSGALQPSALNALFLLALAFICLLHSSRVLRNSAVLTYLWGGILVYSALLLLANGAFCRASQDLLTCRGSGMPWFGIQTGTLRETVAYAATMVMASIQLHFTWPIGKNNLDSLHVAEFRTQFWQLLVEYFLFVAYAVLLLYPLVFPANYLSYAYMVFLWICIFVEIIAPSALNSSEVFLNPRLLIRGLWRVIIVFASLAMLTRYFMRFEEFGGGSYSQKWVFGFNRGVSDFRITIGDAVILLVMALQGRLFNIAKLLDDDAASGEVDNPASELTKSIGDPTMSISRVGRGTGTVADTAARDSAMGMNELNQLQRDTAVAVGAGAVEKSLRFDVPNTSGNVRLNSLPGKLRSVDGVEENDCSEVLADRAKKADRLRQRMTVLRQLNNLRRSVPVMQTQRFVSSMWQYASVLTRATLLQYNYVFEAIAILIAAVWLDGVTVFGFVYLVIGCILMTSKQYVEAEILPSNVTSMATPGDGEADGTSALPTKLNSSDGTSALPTKLTSSWSTRYLPPLLVILSFCLMSIQYLYIIISSAGISWGELASYFGLERVQGADEDVRNSLVPIRQNAMLAHVLVFVMAFLQRAAIRWISFDERRKLEEESKYIMHLAAPLRSDIYNTAVSVSTIFAGVGEPLTSKKNDSSGQENHSPRPDNLGSQRGSAAQISRSESAAEYWPADANRADENILPNVGRSEGVVCKIPALDRIGLPPRAVAPPEPDTFGHVEASGDSSQEFSGVELEDVRQESSNIQRIRHFLFSSLREAGKRGGELLSLLSPFWENWGFDLTFIYLVVGGAVTETAFSVLYVSFVLFIGRLTKKRVATIWRPITLLLVSLVISQYLLTLGFPPGFGDGRKLINLSDDWASWLYLDSLNRDDKFVPASPGRKASITFGFLAVICAGITFNALDEDANSNSSAKTMPVCPTSRSSQFRWNSRAPSVSYQRDGASSHQPVSVPSGPMSRFLSGIGIQLSSTGSDDNHGVTEPVVSALDSVAPTHRGDDGCRNCKDSHRSDAWNLSSKTDGSEFGLTEEVDFTSKPQSFRNYCKLVWMRLAGSLVQLFMFAIATWDTNILSAVLLFLAFYFFFQFPNTEAKQIRFVFVRTYVLLVILALVVYQAPFEAPSSRWDEVIGLYKTEKNKLLYMMLALWLFCQMQGRIYESENFKFVVRCAREDENVRHRRAVHEHNDRLYEKMLGRNKNERAKDARRARVKALGDLKEKQNVLSLRERSEQRVADIFYKVCVVNWMAHLRKQASSPEYKQQKETERHEKLEKATVTGGMTAWERFLRYCLRGEKWHKYSNRSVAREFQLSITRYSSWPVYFTMILAAVVAPSVLTLVYPLVLFMYVIVEQPRPPKQAWTTLLIYVYCVILVKYVARKPGFATCSKEYVVPFFGATGILFSPDTYPSLKNFNWCAMSTGIFFDVLVLLSLMWHRAQLYYRGLWDFPGTEEELRLLKKVIGEEVSTTPDGMKFEVFDEVETTAVFAPYQISHSPYGFLSMSDQIDAANIVLGRSLKEVQELVGLRQSSSFDHAVLVGGDEEFNRRSTDKQVLAYFDQKPSISPRIGGVDRTEKAPALRLRGADVTRDGSVREPFECSATVALPGTGLRRRRRTSDAVPRPDVIPRPVGGVASSDLKNLTLRSYVANNGSRHSSSAALDRYERGSFARPANSFRGANDSGIFSSLLRRRNSRAGDDGKFDGGQVEIAEEREEEGLAEKALLNSQIVQKGGSNLRATTASAQLRPESGSGRTSDGGKVNLAAFNGGDNQGGLLGAIRCHFMRLMAESAHKTVGDYYMLIFSIDFFCFVYMMFGYSYIFESQREGSQILSWWQSNFIGQDHLMALLIMFFGILWDRIVYLRRNMAGKLAIQYLSVLGYHYWLFWKTNIGTRSVGRAFYFLKCVYFLLSGLQIRTGYPLYTTGQYLLRQYNTLGLVLFTVYETIPFLWLTRTLIDWTVVPTSLEIFQYFRFIDIYLWLYRNRAVNTARGLFKRRLGQKRSVLPRFYQGIGLALLCAILLFLPFILFSFLNPFFDQRALLESYLNIDFVSGNSTFRVYSRSTAADELDLKKDGDKIKIKGVIPVLREKEVLYLAQFSSLSESVWIPSQADKVLLADALNISKNVSVPKLRFTLSSLTDSQVFRKSFSVNLPKQNLSFVSAAIGAENPFAISFSTPLPKYLILASGSKTFESFEQRSQEKKKDDSCLRLIYPPESSSSDAPVWSIGDCLRKDGGDEKCDCDVIGRAEGGAKQLASTLNVSSFSIRALLQVADVSSFQLGGGTILTVYAAVLFTVASLAKRLFSNKRLVVPYVDMPYTLHLYQLVLDIIYARQDEDFVMEEILYNGLIDIYRDPAELVRWTGERALKTADDWWDNESRVKCEGYAGAPSFRETLTEPYIDRVVE